MPNPDDPIDLRLDPQTGDLSVSSDLTFTTGLDAVTQSIRILLLTFAGEWKFNLDTGIPYYQKILGSKFSSSQRIIDSEIRSRLATRPNVLQVTSVSSRFNQTTRELTVSWEVDTVFGLSNGQIVG